jgi:Transcriptional regulator/sugar kinase
MKLENDSRIVLTLDAGGTNFRFGAMRGGKPITDTVALPSNADNLEKCLGNLVEGFSKVKASLPEAPVAISFAFPGPSDYPAGIIGDLPNLPAFRGGIALGPMLEEKFGIPTFINNDGDLFVYGEAIAGFLPWVNEQLEKAGSPKRYKNLFGVTMGTGFGGGIVRDGELYIGDNSVAGEVWTLRHKLERNWNAEEGCCIRAVRREYGRLTGTLFDDVPEPKVLFDIANGNAEGDAAAAKEAFRLLGEVAGDAMGEALTLLDGLAVIGGGVSGAWPLFLPALVDELNGTFTGPGGNTFRRLAPKAFNLEDPAQLETFLKGDKRTVQVPGSTKTVEYDPLQRIGVGMSRLGTSESIALGAYAFAVNKLK